MASTLQNTALRFQEAIIEATIAKSPRQALENADIALTQLRTQLRLSHDFGLLKRGQYTHVSAMVNEIGRLLGGWRKKIVV